MFEGLPGLALILVLVLFCSAVLDKLLKAARRAKSSRNNLGRYVPEKYRGDPDKINLRSSWEVNFARWCERDPDVLEWSSEELAIRYRSPGTLKVRRYYPDFVVTRRGADGEETSIVEIKPRYQTEPPSGKGGFISRLKAKKRYRINCAKWKAAEKHAQKRGWKFEIVTEDDPRTQARRGR